MLTPKIPVAVLASLLSCVALGFSQEPQEGYPKTYERFPSPPGVADLDQDGDLEILLKVYEGLHVYKHDGSDLEGWPYEDEESASRIPPLVGDIDEDGELDVIYTWGRGELMAVDATGEPKEGWPVDLNTTSRLEATSLGDLEGDGSLRVITLVPQTRRAYVIDGSGGVVEGWPLSLAYDDVDDQPQWDTYLLDSLAVGDLEFDGAEEILVGAQATYDGEPVDTPGVLLSGDGSELEGWPRLVESGDLRSSFRSPTIVDVDQDGVCELFGKNGGTQLLSTFSDGQQFVSPIAGHHNLEPVFGDLDGDGRLEVIVAEQSGLIAYSFVYDEIADAWDTEVYAETDDEYEAFFALAVADVDGDGCSEILAQSGSVDGRTQAAYHLYRGTLDAELDDWPHEPDGTIHTGGYGVCLVDLDNDNDIEAIYRHQLTLYVWDIDNPSSGAIRSDWSMRRNNAMQNSFFHGAKQTYLRGDANGDGVFQLADIILLAAVLGMQDSAPCEAALDVDANNSVGVSDLLALITYVYLSGAQPSGSYPECDFAYQRGFGVPCNRANCD